MRNQQCRRRSPGNFSQIIWSVFFFFQVYKPTNDHLLFVFLFVCISRWISTKCLQLCPFSWLRHWTFSHWTLFYLLFCRISIRWNICWLTSWPLVNKRHYSIGKEKGVFHVNFFSFSGRRNACLLCSVIYGFYHASCVRKSSIEKLQIVRM